MAEPDAAAVPAPAASVSFSALAMAPLALEFTSTEFGPIVIRSFGLSLLLMVPVQARTEEVAPTVIVPFSSSS